MEKILVTMRARTNIFALVFLNLDHNECTNEEIPCGLNARCVNTAGSFQCKCNEGYIGDGNKCTGKYILTNGNIYLHSQVKNSLSDKQF